MSRFAKYSWFVLGFNLLVIIWGAFVRATGSGAGCGSHWPLCNGEVIPRAPEVATLIEFSHRTTSGLLGLFCILLAIWAFRAFPPHHVVRRAAALSLFLVIVEGLLGAGLVRLEYVAHNASMGRAIWMGGHLVNTFLLTAALLFTAWWASGGQEIRLQGQGAVGWLVGIGIIATIVLGVTGAVTALGATLFPASSIAEGVAQDISASSPLLLRIRLVHPIVAMVTGIYLVIAAGAIQGLRPSPETRRFATWLSFLFVVQVIAGMINMALHAPVWMQLVHLLLADLLWIVLLLLGASALVEGTSTPLAEASPSLAGSGD